MFRELRVLIVLTVLYERSQKNLSRFTFATMPWCQSLHRYGIPAKMQ